MEQIIIKPGLLSLFIHFLLTNIFVSLFQLHFLMYICTSRLLSLISCLFTFFKSIPFKHSNILSSSCDIPSSLNYQNMPRTPPPSPLQKFMDLRRLLKFFSVADVIFYSLKYYLKTIESSKNVKSESESAKARVRSYRSFDFAFATLHFRLRIIALCIFAVSFLCPLPSLSCISALKAKLSTKTTHMAKNNLKK